MATKREKRKQRRQKYIAAERAGEKGFVIQKTRQAIDKAQEFMGNFRARREQQKEKLASLSTGERKQFKQEKRQALKKAISETLTGEDSVQSKKRKILGFMQNVVSIPEKVGKFVLKEVVARPAVIVGKTFLDEQRRFAEKQGRVSTIGKSFERGVKEIFPEDEPRSLQDIYSESKQKVEESGVATKAEKALLPLLAVGGTLFAESPFGAPEKAGGKIAKEVGEEFVEKGAKKLITSTDNIPQKELVPQGLHKEITPQVSEQIPYTKTVPQGETAVNRVIQALKKAKSLGGKQKQLYSKERAKRVARVASIGKKVKGEKGFYAQLGQLKGELPKVQFESIRKDLQQADVDELFQTIQDSEILSEFEKISAKGGLRKLFGETGVGIPNQSELKLLSEIFPEEFIQGILEKRPFMEKLFNLGLEGLSLPRAMMATADLSAPMRQGIFFVGRPKQWIPAFRDMFKYAFSENAYQGLLKEIQSRPTYKLMRESKLDFTDMSKLVNSREEQFMSSFAEKIPIFGKIAKGSNRAYTGFLNKLRADVFDDLVKKAKLLNTEAEYPEVYENIAKFVNSATGRGDLGALKRAAPILNATLFSPRLMASRLNLLSPYYYYKLDPFTRKEALKSLFTFTASAATVLGLMSLIPGVEVGTDTRSSDFAKLKIGNTRYDMLGGFQQYIKLVFQLISGKVVSSTTGKTITLGEGYKPLTRRDILLRFIENKESPVMSFATALATGQSALGGELDVPAEVVNRFIPLVAQDMFNLAKERGPGGLGMAIPGVFGVGSQTYGKQELVFGESKIGQPTAQIRPQQGLGETVSEKVFGKKPLGTSTGYSVEKFYEQMLELPREEAAQIWDEINSINPDLAKKITKVAQEKEQGITVEDKQLKEKGVASGDRALAIKKELDKLKTNDEKADLWDEYVAKKIITKDVEEQLLYLLNQ